MMRVVWEMKKKIFDILVHNNYGVFKERNWAVFYIFNINYELITEANIFILFSHFLHYSTVGDILW